MDQLSKKERRELKRQKKVERHLSQKRGGVSKNYTTWIVLFIVVGALVYGLSLRSERPGEVISIQNRDHISESDPTPTYNSNPPTSGPHAGPVKGGFYSSEIKDINAVHNLEHGFIWITYKDADDETIKKLKRIGNKFSESVVVSLRKSNDSKLVLASWGRMEKMDIFDEEMILNFIRRNKNKSPEQLAR